MNNYAFFDIDNTIYRGYSTSDFYLWLVENSYVGNWVRKEDKRLGKLYWSGKIDYKEASIKVVSLLAKALKGKTTSEVNNWKKQFMNEKKRLFPWVPEVFSLLEERSFIIYLISAAGAPVVEAIAEYLQADKYFASEYTIKDSIFTGEMKHMLNFDQKAKLIHRIAGHLKNHTRIFAFGDSTGDIEMLKVANTAFVINPHEDKMKKIAKKYKWITTTNEQIVDDIVSHTRSGILKAHREL